MNIKNNNNVSEKELLEKILFILTHILKNQQQNKQKITDLEEELCNLNELLVENFSHIDQTLQNIHKNTYISKIKNTLYNNEPLKVLYSQIYIENFIDHYIVAAPICSEKLNDVYNYYQQFVEQEHPSKEILKKRSFKKALKTVLQNREIKIDEITTNVGVLLIGIDIKTDTSNDS